MKDDTSLIREQIEYYKARAAEYDEWFLRQGRYDRREQHREQWNAETTIVQNALEGSHPHGRILELACGTGLWTRHLAPLAEKVTAVDISPEMIRQNRRRLADDRVEYVNADLFSWTPSETYDYIFFSFWLSHVPSSRFDNFWTTIEDALAPDGQVFFVDSRFEPESTASDHPAIDRNGVARRRLNDGREFEIVKVFYEPSALEQALSDRDWTGYVRSTSRFFLYGCVRRSG